MMTIELKQILQGIPGKWVGDDRIRIAKMEFDSRKVQQGDLFVARITSYNVCYTKLLRRAG